MLEMLSERPACGRERLPIQTLRHVCYHLDDQRARSRGYKQSVIDFQIIWRGAVGLKEWAAGSAAAAQALADHHLNRVNLPFNEDDSIFFQPAEVFLDCQGR